MESQKRTLAKTITWRAIAFITTVVVVYLYSGDMHESLVVGIGANALKMVFYYIHERAWNKSEFGRVKAPEYQI
ncbi:MAG: DUF2061 domain-containing protein [Candidatus Zapsychrus exili]|nr:DUF2061 domain-containing protein [Candidatus Zapsychrus exili]